MKKQNDSLAGGIAAILRANKTRFQHGDRVRYDDDTVAQFPAAWLDKTAEPAQ